MNALLIVRNAALVVSLMLAGLGLLGLLPGALDWRRWSRATAFAGLSAHAGATAIRTQRREQPLTTMALPVLAAVFVLAWLIDPGARWLVYGAPLIDIAIVLGLCGFAMTLRSSPDTYEERLERLMDRWLPSKYNALAARIAALDLVGYAYVFGGWRKPPPPGIAYYKNNSLLPLVALVFFWALPEFFVVELFLGKHAWYWHLLDAVLHGYAVFWFVALFASMRQRPHAIVNGVLVVRRGLFDTIRVPLASIASISPAPALSTKALRSLGPAVAYLGLFGAPLLCLPLTQPCFTGRLIGKQRLVETILAPVDDIRTAIPYILEAKALRA